MYTRPSRKAEVLEAFSNTSPHSSSSPKVDTARSGHEYSIVGAFNDCLMATRAIPLANVLGIWKTHAPKMLYTLRSKMIDDNMSFMKQNIRT